MFFISVKITPRQNRSSSRCCSSGSSSHGVVFPVVVQIPEGDWICPGCNAQASDNFCFKEGQDCTLPEFEAIANQFKNEYMNNLAARLDKKVEDILWQDLERDFWQVVESGDEPVEVRRGRLDPVPRVPFSTSNDSYYSALGSCSLWRLHW